MRRVRPLLVSTLLVVAACSGSDGTAATTTMAGAPSETTEPQGATTTAATAAVGSFADVAALVDLPAGDPYTDHREVADDDNLIEIRVPVQWSDIWSGSWSDFGIDNLGPYAFAAPDQDRWYNSWGMEGVFLGASAILGMTPTEALDASSYSGSCDFVGRFGYDDGRFAGIWDLYQTCGDEGSVFLVIGVTPAGTSALVYIEVVAVTVADLSAADEILGSLRVAENLSG